MVIVVGGMGVIVYLGGNIMPRGDRRGPNGMGPMTGRAAGLCSGSSTPGYVNGGVAGGYGQGMGAGRGAGRQQVGCSHMQPYFGGGFHGAANGSSYGRGMGRAQGINRGMGFQRMNAAPVVSKETEKAIIENEVSFLKDQLKSLEGRLTDMQDDE